MRLPFRSFLVLGIWLVIGGGLPATAAVAASSTPPLKVTTMVDKISKRGGCSLREAVLAVNSQTRVGGCRAPKGSTTILIPEGTYQLGIAGRQEDAGRTGDLDVMTSMKIIGQGNATTGVDAAGLDRVLDIHGAVQVTIKALSVYGGESRVYVDGEIYNGESGGAIKAPAADLTILNASVSGSALGTNEGPFGYRPSGNGGAIYVETGSLSISNGAIDGAGWSGGAVYLGSGQANVATSSLSGAAVQGGNGGAVYVGQGSLRIENANIAGTGWIGGALYVASGRADVVGSSLSGSAISDGGAVGNGTGEFNLLSSRIEASSAISSGAISNGGQATIERTVIDGNAARGRFGSGKAGAITNTGGMTIDQSTLSNNSGDFVGAIWNRGRLAISRSTISSNIGGTDSGGMGVGGIASTGDLIIDSSTIAYNIGQDGGSGGITNYLNGTLLVRNSTISGNDNGLVMINPATPGGIAGSATLLATIVAENDSMFEDPDGSHGTILYDCNGPVTSLGTNLIGTTGGCTIAVDSSDIVGLDPLLGALSGNGGGTLTMLPTEGSPAVDAGPATCPAVDQRGAPRPMDGDGDGVPVCDIGAVENQP